jgi:hypothetical protein
MKVEINPRGNGACPICIANGNCPLQQRLGGSLASMNGQDSEMELVIYSCSYFKEKA